MTSKILIIGATSAIAHATARRFAERGDALFLVGRDADKLAAVAADLSTRGAQSIDCEALDVLDYDSHISVLDAAVETLGGLDMVLIAHGSLPDQAECEHSFDCTRREFGVNALSTISLLTHLANRCEAQRHGTIVVISSVAGDRGRKSNYVYGTTKGALTIFVQGLRNRLHESGVRVITVKPGLVDTPMTTAFDKGPLWSDPDRIAVRILSAIKSHRDVVYAPRYWRLIMLVIRAIPERFFKRLDL